MTLHAYTDGASRGNPGKSGIGIIVRTEEGRTILRMAGSIGVATNNVAEYTALLTLLKKARELDCDRLIVHSDSELMVRQMNGEYKIKNPEIARFHSTIRDLLGLSTFAFEIKYIPREMNSEADQLANEGIESGVKLADDAL
jgi:ribonuclease HI